MDNQWKSRITLLSLLSIFFIYKAIMGLVENSLTEFTFWFIFAILYLISLLILYFVMKRRQSE